MDCNQDDTFWTMCDGCSFQYRFVRTHLNHALTCLHCKRSFTAIETAPPRNSGNSSTLPSINVTREHKPSPVEAASGLSGFTARELRKLMLAKANRELRNMLDMWEASDRAHKRARV